MSKRPAAETHVDTDALIATIDACRRRMLWIAFVRISPAAVAGVLVAAWITATAGGFDVRGWLAPAWAGGVALAALAVWLRAPSRGDCAAAIDRALALPDVAAAGIELRHARDPVGTLVVRDAAARLRGVSPAQVFPVRLDARSHAAAAVCAVATLAITFGVPQRATEPDLLTSGGGMGVGAGPAETVAEVGEAAPQGRAVPAIDANDTTFAKAIAPLEQQTATEAASPTAGSAAAAGERGRSRREVGTGEGSLNRVQASAVRAGAEPAAAQPAPEGASSRGTSSPAGETTARRAAAEGRGAGGDGSQPALAAAGGLAGGTRAAPGAPGRVQRPDGRPYAARYNAAREQAEAALRRDDVPPAYREYVRRYFEAIAPAEQE